MDTESITQRIEAGIPDARVMVSGGGGKFTAVVVSGAFAGKSMLQAHKMVYATVAEEIASGALHALTVKAYTPEQWQLSPEVGPG